MPNFCLKRYRVGDSVVRVKRMSIIYGVLLFSGYFGFLAGTATVVSGLPTQISMALFAIVGVISAFVVIKIQAALERRLVRRYLERNPYSLWRYCKF